MRSQFSWLLDLLKSSLDRWLAPLCVDTSMYKSAITVAQPAQVTIDQSRAQSHLAAQKALIAAFISSREYRDGSRAEAITALLQPLCHVLGVDRVSLWLNDASGKTCAREFLYQQEGTTDVGFVSFAWAELPRYRAALERQDVIVAPDVLAAPHLEEVHRRFPELRKLRSRINAPMFRDGELIGEIVASTVQRHAEWLPEQVQFMREVAMLATLVLERHERIKTEQELRATNLQLAETATRDMQSQRRLRAHQDALSALVSSEAFRSGTRDEAVRALLSTVREVLHADRATFWLNTEDDSYCERVHAELRDGTNPLAMSRIVWSQYPDLLAAISCNEVLVASDATTAPHLACMRDLNPATRTVKSRIDAPMIRAGRLTGLISVGNHTTYIDWTSEQIQFMREIATMGLLILERHERLESEQQLQATNEQLAQSVARSERAKSQLALHKAATAELIASERFRKGTRSEAIEALLQTMGRVLDCDRVAFWCDARDGNVCLLEHFVLNGEVVHGANEVFCWAGQNRYREALQCNDVLATRDAAAAPYLADVASTHRGIRAHRSRIETPLFREGRLAGLIIASTHTREIDWTSEHKQSMREFAAIALLILERQDRLTSEIQLRISNADLAAEMRRREQSERTLSLRQRTISELIGSATRGIETRAHALQTIIDRCRTELGLDRVGIWLSEGGSDKCVRLMQSDRAPISAPAFTTFDWSYFPLYRAALERGDPLVAPDAHAAPHLVEVAKTFPSQFGIMSRIDVPIMQSGALVGVLMGTTINTDRSWQGEDVVFVSAIGSVIALVIERHERLRIEQELRHANEKVAGASKAKSLFLANMSHEIRTPMNGVFGMTDLLMRTQLTERQGRLVETISHSARTLLTIINDILDLSRIEAGRLDLDEQEFDIRSTVEGAVELFIEDGRRKNIDLDVFVATTVPERFLGDAGRLRQVCVNLIGNAVKFTQTGGVSVRVTPRVSVDGTPRGVVVEVRDTGLGISAEMQRRIFQPFSQADSSISRRFGGTGLGLSISMHLVRLMGGDITLDSAEGKGTTVRFELPLISVDAPFQIVPTGMASLTDARVLIIDDREINREIIADYLSGTASTIATARNASEAIARIQDMAARGTPFDLLLLDMVMPGMDGLELTQVIRTMPAMSTSGIVMLTSLSWDGDARAARARGVSELLTKPVRRSDLIEACLRALGTGTCQPVAKQSATPAPALTAHVLLAEDNPVNVEVASEYLNMLGITCEVAMDGREAEALFRASRFDAVLMDCQMPEVDGLTATRAIRAYEAAEDRPPTPIIAVTANAYESDRLACLEAGMDDYLSKPFSEEQLSACLMRWVQARQVAALEAAADSLRSTGTRVAPRTDHIVSEPCLAAS